MYKGFENRKRYQSVINVIEDDKSERSSLLNGKMEGAAKIGMSIGFLMESLVK